MSVVIDKKPGGYVLRMYSPVSFYNRRFLCQYMLCFFIFSKKLVQCGYYFVIFTVDIHVAEI